MHLDTATREKIKDILKESNKDILRITVLIEKDGDFGIYYDPINEDEIMDDGELINNLVFIDAPSLPYIKTISVLDSKIVVTT